MQTLMRILLVNELLSGQKHPFLLIFLFTSSKLILVFLKTVNQKNLPVDGGVGYLVQMKFNMKNYRQVVYNIYFVTLIS